jgi:hypothetical protein
MKNEFLKIQASGRIILAADAYIAEEILIVIIIIVITIIISLRKTCSPEFQ